MKRKIIVISIIIIFCLFVANTNNGFITNTEQLVPFLFTVLGLCLTAYTFIYAPISEILKKESMKNEETKKKLQNLLNSFEEDMKLIFFLTIFILLIDSLNEIDVPLVKNAHSIDLGVMNIISLKQYIYNFFTAASASLSFYALYDLMEATFKILRKSFDK